MDLTKIYDFNTPSEYTYDSNKVDISSGTAKLKLINNPGQDFIQDFTNDTGFVYNPAVTEFTAGQVQQKDQRPANSIIGAKYASSLNANWAANGFLSLTANLNGVPTVSGGKASCIGTQGFYYQDSIIGNLSGNWVAKFKYTPQYTSGPASNVNILSIATPGVSTDRVIIFDNPTSLRITANGLAAVSFGSWSPVSGTEYDFEIHCVNNVVSLYVDNVQIGSGQTITPGQGTGTTQVWLGAYTGIYNTANALFDEFILYSTAAQTPTYTIPNAAYLTDIITVPEMEYTGVGTLISFDSFVTSEGGVPRYTLQIGQSGNYLYWNGAAWVVSNNTYAQANDVVTFNANVGSLPVSGEIYVQFRIYTTDTNSQGFVNTLTASLTAQIYPVDNPTVLFQDTTMMEELKGFSDDKTITGNDNVKYILSKDNVQYYWDGAAWIVSNGTYAQSNTATEIETNKATFTTERIILEIIMFLHSDNGITTPIIDDTTIIYDFVGTPNLPHTTIVYGFAYNPDGSPSTDLIKVSLSIGANEYNAVNQIIDNDVAIRPRVNGYWEQNLVDNYNMESGSFYFFNFKTKTDKKIVPATDSIAYNNLADG